MVAYPTRRHRLQVTPQVHRIGDDRVACYLIEEAGALTVVDAGMSGHYGELLTELSAMGRTLNDIHAVVLTHGHDDHIGFAERIRAEQGFSVSVHELDAALARGEVPNPSAGIGQKRLGSMLAFLLFAMRKGALRTRKLTEVSTFADSATLDVPGALKVIATPGHTPGSCALHAAGHDALFVGDAICTNNVATGRRAPQVSPFTADPDQALASLADLEAIQAGWLLPGHGEPWTDGVAAAVAAAREVGIEHLPRR